jgi:hypothetical protein
MEDELQHVTKFVFVSVDGALMFEATTYTNVVLLATLIWLGQTLQ